MNAGRLDSFPVLSRIVFQNIVKDRGHDASGSGPYGFAETHQSFRGERIEFDGKSDGEIVRIVFHGGHWRR
jgi:aromatic ring-opening dioxygenase LigB subunit